MYLKRWTAKASGWFQSGLPGYCAFCLSPEQNSEGWCRECFEGLARNTNACSQCKEPLGRAAHHQSRCGHCLTNPPAFTATTAELLFEGPVRALVHDFKFNASPRAGMLLVELMLSFRPESVGEALLPVPMHPSRARERGFNQAHWLASQLAQRLERPVLEALCVKSLPAQRSLNRRERARNLAGAFRLQGAPPAHITIIDDVVTTGATGHALASIALQAGAQRVDIWAVARTPLEQN